MEKEPLTSWGETVLNDVFGKPCACGFNIDIAFTLQYYALHRLEFDGGWWRRHVVVASDRDPHAVITRCATCLGHQVVTAWEEVPEPLRERLLRIDREESKPWPA